MVNEGNQGIKIVGGRPLKYSVTGLTHMLSKVPILSRLLEEEKLLLAKKLK